MTAKIATAIHEVMSKVGYVQKGGINKFHNYKYAGEADLLDKLRPAMLEAGLMLLPSVKSTSPIDEYGNVFVNMEYTLVHKDGDIWPDKLGAIGCGNDKNNKGGVGDKGVYKAITGANKYVLFKLFQIETGDDPEIASDGDKGGKAVKEPDAEWGSRDGVNVSRLLFKIIEETVTQQSDVIEFRESNKGMIASLPVKMRAELNARLDSIGATNPVSDESRAAFMEELRVSILEFENAASLSKWWKEADTKQRIADFDLTDAEYKEIYDFMIAHGKKLSAQTSIETKRDAA